MKRLQVGVICYPTVGGSGVVATELAKKMAMRGHTMHFIASSQPFRLEQQNERLRFHEVVMEQYAAFQHPPYDIALANTIAQVIQKERLDLLHVHYAVPHAVAASLGRHMANSTIPMVTTLHGTDVTVLGEQPNLKQTVKYGIEQSTITTAVSHALRDDTYRLIAPNRQIETVYNFIDETTYKVDRSMRTATRTALGVHDDRPVFIHISNFRRVKRIDYVIASFAHILRQIDAHLVLVGDGPERANMEHLAKLYDVSRHVTFTGKRQDPARLLNAADAMLHLSDKEAFGLVLLEAFACGIPAVATKIGGIPEVVTDGVNGYLVPLDVPDVVAQRAVELVTSPRYDAFCEAALHTASTEFHSTTIVDQYERLYERAVIGHD